MPVMRPPLLSASASSAWANGKRFSTLILTSPECTAATIAARRSVVERPKMGRELKGGTNMFTMSCWRDRLVFRAGAGIVADSVAERELKETRAKALGLLRALGAAA